MVPWFAGVMTDAMATLLARGQAAVEAIQQAPSAAATQAADAFQELQVIRELLEAATNKQYDRALQVCIASFSAFVGVGTCALGAVCHLLDRHSSGV
jgi:hypothetical protein